LLYQCLTGDVPFPHDTQAGCLHAHLFEPPPSLAARGASTSVALDEAIGKGMAKRPERRHRTAGDLIDAAYAALSAEHSHARVPTSPPGRMRSRRPRRASEPRAPRIRAWACETTRRRC
jgi:hypothetical protein